MYSLKPIIALPENIDLPKVMYELPKIHGKSSSDEADSKDDEFIIDLTRQTPLPEFNLLEARQNKILKDVFELKSYLDQITVAVRINQPHKLDLEPFSIKTRNAFTNKSGVCSGTPVNAEIIVNANPASPPYIILALQRLWKDVKFNVKVYTNSCNGDVSKNLVFEEKLLSNAKSNTAHNIDVTLIWKNVKDTQFITQVYDYPFEGEANILRYLVRIIELYNYEKLEPEVSVAIDNVLDMCLRLPYEEPRFKSATIGKFVSLLNEKPWLLNSSDPSIVDMAVWSVLKREASNKIPQKLKSWFDLCEKTFLSV